ncbi:hypothetical protein DWX58_03530 [Pseudoflavonifractor sp. AF19-9AC]|uniref:M56 family metallopeptidase n=1 Tax=Pseudoflavonifractor sp. AF19-9AC TaxID=2292244 RepID=UPI000E46CE61|nr:M56 family metallopeptidase [Pseudoflavonifractor sp. AF19-9AC]RHR10480.1 hypothetical protein DWX58_03530 [Pseudoflavonifractor sp. AF19-9AC]
MMQLLPNLFPLSLTCGAVILLLLLLTPVLSRRFTPRWRYWAWLFVAVRLVVPFSLSWHPVELSAPASLTAPSYDPQMTREVEQANPYGWQGKVTGDTTYQVWYTDDQNTEHRIVDLMLVRLEGVDGVWSTSFRWNYIWAAGWAVSFALLVLGYLRLCRQMARRRLPASREAQEELERQRRLLSVTGNVRLFQVPGLASPLLMGFLRPTVLLPHDLPSAALPVALAHELQHLKRQDLWYKLLLSLVGCIHWFNPLVRIMVCKGGQDVELCCDYDLLKTRDVAGRRAYGQAILDQMTAGDRGLSRLTTGFSGDKKEVFARFKAMMDTAPKRRGRIALAAALVVVVLAGSLVGCQTGAGTPEGDGAWIADINPEAGTVTYYPLSQGLIGDEDALEEWLWGEDGMAAEEPRTVSLSEDIQFRHTYDGETYSIPASTIQFSVSMTQTGALGEVEVKGGKAVRVQLASAAHLDLSVPNLDFTGYCGTVYAVGMGGARFQDGMENLSVDPCTETGADGDHTYYTLPLAPDAAISEEDLPFLTGLSSAAYPNYWQLTLVDGQVTSINRLWEASIRALETMSTLRAEDIATISFSGGPVASGWLERLDREELAQLIQLAAGQPPVAEREYSDENGLDYGLWSLDLRLTNGEILSLNAGRAEDQISVTEPVCLDGCTKLYQLIRTATDSTQVISVTDSEVLSVMNEVLSDTLDLWHTPDYGGGFEDSYLEAQLTRLEQPALPESLGENVELYVYDFGFVVEDLFHVLWAGAPWVDSQLRYHPGGNYYLAVERAEDGSITRWGAFQHEFSPPFDNWELETWEAFSANVQSALARGGVE